MNEQDKLHPWILLAYIALTPMDRGSNPTSANALVYYSRHNLGIGCVSLSDAGDDVEELCKQFHDYNIAKWLELYRRVKFVRVVHDSTGTYDKAMGFAITTRGLEHLQQHDFDVQFALRYAEV